MREHACEISPAAGRPAQNCRLLRSPSDRALLAVLLKLDRALQKLASEATPQLARDRPRP